MKCRCVKSYSMSEYHIFKEDEYYEYEVSDVCSCPNIYITGCRACSILVKSHDNNKFIFTKYDDPMHKLNHGYFSDYFITNEEDRNNKINEILSLKFAIPPI